MSMLSSLGLTAFTSDVASLLINQLSDIDKDKQELIREHLKDIDIYEAIGTIVHRKKIFGQQLEGVAEWEGCKIEFNTPVSLADLLANLDPDFREMQGLDNITAEAFKGLVGAPLLAIRVTMEDGTIILETLLDGKCVRVFRDGPWVQRLLDYASELEAEKSNKLTGRIDF